MSRSSRSGNVDLTRGIAPAREHLVRRDEEDGRLDRRRISSGIVDEAQRAPIASVS